MLFYDFTTLLAFCGASEGERQLRDQFVSRSSSVCPSVILLVFIYDFQTLHQINFIFGTYVPLWQDGVINFGHMKLIVTFDLHLENFISAHSSLTVRHRAFIFGICRHYVKTFRMVIQFFITWPWSWLFTYFRKTFTQPITFFPWETGLSYLAWDYHNWHVCSLWAGVIRPFCCGH